MSGLADWLGDSWTTVAIGSTPAATALDERPASRRRRQGIHRIEDLRRVLLEPSGGAVPVVADDDPPLALGPAAVTVAVSFCGRSTLTSLAGTSPRPHTRRSCS